MIRIFFLFFLFSLNLFSFSKKFLLLDEGLSINGLSGGIFTPSSLTLPYKKYAIGIHNYRIKISYGFFKNLEGGIIFDSEDIENISKQTLKRFNFGVKYSFFREPLFPVSLSSGFQGSRTGETKNFFFSISKFFDYFNGVNLQAGGKVFKENEKYRFKQSVVFDILIPYGMFIFDYSGKYNLGLRIFLSRFTPKLKFDLFLTSIEKGMELFEDLYIGFTWSE